MRLKIEFEFLKDYKELVGINFTPDEEFLDRFGVGGWAEVKTIINDDNIWKVCSCNVFTINVSNHVIYIPCDKTLTTQPRGVSSLNSSLMLIRLFNQYDFVEIVNNLASEPLEFDLKERSKFKRCSLT